MQLTQKKQAKKFSCAVMGLKLKRIFPLVLQNIQDKYKYGTGLTLESK